MEKIFEFIDKCGRLIELYRLCGENYNAVKDFYTRGIEGLSDKAFFANFTDEELTEALSDPRGIFVGAYHNGRLVGLSAVDGDRAYGDKLKAFIVAIATKNDVFCYEYSGVFVLEDYRRAGIAGAVMFFLINYAKINLAPCYLCGVVQHNNEASINNFVSHGFVYGGTARKDETFLFNYYLLEVNKGD